MCHTKKLDSDCKELLLITERLLSGLTRMICPMVVCNSMRIGYENVGPYGREWMHARTLMCMVICGFVKLQDASA